MQILLLWLATSFGRHRGRAHRLLAICLLLSSNGALASPAVIYMSPQGSDLQDGSTLGKAVAGLQRAYDLAIAAAEKDMDVRILIATGSYRDQRAIVNAQVISQTIDARPLDPKAARPVFDAGQSGGTWLTLAAGKGSALRLAVHGLEITNYETAITLNGNRDATDMANGGHTIRNNVFRNIGQGAANAAKPSTAAVRLVNSDGNFIFRNQFIGIRNRERCGLIHAIYVAHNSVGNRIEDNIFEESCGDVIRFRDASDNNVVKDNRFVDAWDKSPVSDWYCAQDVRDDCTKKTGECPSVGNVIVNNTVIAKKLKKPPLTMAHGLDETTACPRAPSGHGRFIIE